jgi:1-pyrroline-5-carboxylate dehydrogenase
MLRIYAEQPVSSPGVWNRMEYRPLEGFVFAVTPFNFTSIAGNLPTAPAILGNVAVWKPASSSIYSAHFIMDILEEAGLPPGVINMVPGSGSKVGDPALASGELAGLHFTGSTEVFRGMWKTMAENLPRYKGYPRIVGETGGKDFIFAHASAHVPALVTAMVRGAFEFQGQKCSAASRAYIPASLWPQVREGLLAQVSEIKVGDPTDFTNFMGAVIDSNAFKSIRGYIDHAQQSPDAEILLGGTCGDTTGYFIEPTVVLAKSPDLKLMREEIFGPVLTVFVYPDAELDRALELVDRGSPYALTGAIFSQDRRVIHKLTEAVSKIETCRGQEQIHQPQIHGEDSFSLIDHL